MPVNATTMNTHRTSCKPSACATETEPAIRTYRLTKRFGATVAVADLDLTVPQGTVYGLLGPNGAGKTTTMRMLLGLVHPTSGRAEILGLDCRLTGARAAGRVGAFVEGPAFYPHLSGRTNLRILCDLSGAGHEEIDWALEQVGLLHAADQSFGTYSHGMRQRLGIAAALLPRPRLLILDEPAAGLDPAGLREVRELLRTLAAEGITIFLSSHLLHEVQDLCTHVGIMFNGRLVASGLVCDLLNDELVRVEIAADNLEAAAQAVRPLTATVQRSADGRLTVVAAYEQLPQLARALVNAGVNVYSITPRGKTLEDLYMEYATRTNASTTES